MTTIFQPGEILTYKSSIGHCEYSVKVISHEKGKTSFTAEVIDIVMNKTTNPMVVGEIYDSFSAYVFKPSAEHELYQALNNLEKRL